MTVTVEIRADVLEEALREWVHSSPLNRCNAGSDTCESWPVVDEIMAHIRKRAVSVERITHGRHCICSACAQENWARPELAPCGMHGPDCPPRYAPLGNAGEVVRARVSTA